MRIGWNHLEPAKLNVPTIQFTRHLNRKNTDIWVGWVSLFGSEPLVLEVIEVAFVIVRGRLQRQDDNINIIETRLETIDTRVMDKRPSWFDGDHDRSDEVNLQTLVFNSVQRLTRADIQSVQPRAHNYR